MPASRPWTPEWDDLLRQAFALMSAPELARLLGRSVSAVRARAAHLGLRRSPAWRSEHARQTTLQRSPFTPALREIVELMYPVQRTEDLAQLVGLPVKSIHAYANRRGLHKTPELVREMARERMTPDHPARRHHFGKNHEPWNKGVKGVSFPGSVPTQFKPGHRPHTWKPVGSYRVNAAGYLDRKVSDTGYPPRDWQPVHRLVWIEAHGPVPPGHVITFRPGRRTAQLELITLDAIECVHRGVIAKRNHPRSLSPELGRLIQLRAALARQINQRSKQLPTTTTGD